MNPRKLPLLRTLTRFGLLFGFLATEAQAANLFLKQDIPGWPHVPRYSWWSAWGDYDGDGLLDVFVPRSQTASLSGATTNLLYRNNGDGSFTPRSDASVGALVGDQGASIAGHWIDVNGDGFLDLWAENLDFVAPYPAVVSPLYLNRGDGTFASVQAGALTQPGYPSACNSDWIDYDNDGLLDVFIPMGWVDYPTRTNVLLHGRADGTFEAVTTGPVVTDLAESTNDSIWGDLDNDGDADLLVANNFAVSFHYRNDGHGQFTRMPGSILERPNHAAVHHGLADIDNDGDLDVMVRGSSTFIFRNDGTGTFALGQTLPGSTWETAYFGDYDNDGDADLLFSEVSAAPRPLTLYRNDGTGKFATVSEAFTGIASSWVVGPWVDFDNNGFLDLFVGRGVGTNHPVALYRNQGNTNHWLTLRLVGTQSNRSALGAKVRVRATIDGRDVWQMRSLSSSIWTEDGGRAHFGLGDATQADEIRIEWPSGNVQTLGVTPADHFLTVTEPTVFRPQRPVVTINGTLAITNPATATSRQWYFEGALLEGKTNRILTLERLQPAQAGRYTLVAQTTTGPTTNHVYARVDPLFTKVVEGEIVTESESTSMGLWFDYDGDGYADLFTPNGTAPNSVLRNRGDGTLERLTGTPLVDQPDRNTVLASPADFDNDGDTDLFVVSFGKPSDLFRNDGAGVFQRAEVTLLATGPLWAGRGWADFDGDGDLDLFAAATGAYSLSRNDGNGTFTALGANDAGELLANPPRSQPFVANWNDFDADGDADLLVVHAPGTHRLYENRGRGHFGLRSAGSLTTLPSDYWCAWGDYDNDGFMDAYTTRWQAGMNRLHHNLRDGTFAAVNQAGDLRANSDSLYATWADYDNDGYLDLLAMGYNSGGGLYRNRGDGTFESVEIGNLLSDGVNRSSFQWADIDHNGFLDLFVACGDGIVAPNQLYRNNGNGNHWLQIKLVGTASNRDAIGARVRLQATIGGRSLRQMRELWGDGGNEAVVHFGLGDATRADTVRIEWPSGVIQELTGVAADRFLTITEPTPIRLAIIRSGEALQLELRGAASASYELQRSADLKAWNPAATLTTDAVGLAVAPVVSPVESVFYRAIQR